MTLHNPHIIILSLAVLFAAGGFFLWAWKQ